MLNLESKDYKRYIGRTFDSWDDLIDVNGEVDIDRDRLRAKLEQDYFVEEQPNGSVRLMGPKENGKPKTTTTQPSNNLKPLHDEYGRLWDALQQLPSYQKLMRDIWRAENPYVEGDFLFQTSKYDPATFVNNTEWSDAELLNRRIDALRVQYRDHAGLTPKIKWEPQPRKKPQVKGF